jgi:hypothetical protein
VFKTLIRAAQRWPRIVIACREHEQVKRLHRECGLTPPQAAGAHLASQFAQVNLNSEGTMKRRHWGMAVVVLTALACQAETVLVSERPDVRRQEQRRGHENVDDRMAALADELPGFAGVYFDSAGSMVLRLKDLGQAEAARSRLSAWFAAKPDPWSKTEGVAFASAALVRDARYDYRQLHTWFGRVVAEVMGQEGVISGAISSRRNQLVIGVDHHSRISTMVDELLRMGIPEAAVTVKQRPAMGGARSTDLTDRVRPVIGGLAISYTSQDKCTLAYNADHNNTGYWYFLTNSHCSQSWASIDTVYHAQPNTDGSNNIAVEVSDPATFDYDDDNNCPPSEECRYADVSLFRYTGSSSDWKHGYVAFPGSQGSTTYTVEKRVIGNVDPYEGQWVYKVGMKSGRSFGQVEEDCALWENTTTGWSLPCQIEVTDSLSKEGDSGSPVFSTYGDGIIARGILWGTTDSVPWYIASPITAALGELNADFGGSLCINIACSPPPSAYMTGPSVIPEDVWCTWQASATGGVPPYSYAWSGVLSGTGSSIQGPVTSPGWLTVTVTDDVNNTDYESLYITIDPYATGEGCVED